MGASLAFLLGRYFARSRIEGLTENSGKLQAIDRAICTQGWKIIGLMRLSPVIPFNLSNYFYGITSMGFWPYVLASAGGML
ncbi:MAG: VTT domain-containing protein, partial [Pseudomonadota bacterium]|nr:VTT domain-containing protein [Pseudomonadota bacterium]